MHKNIRNALVALGVAVIVTPAAVSEGSERDANAKPEHHHGPPASVVERHADHKAKHEAKHGAKKVAYVFKGTWSADGVKVLKGNKAVRRAGFVGQTVVFDLSAARVVVADNNGDGKRDASDLQDGDKVVVQARLARRDPGAAPFAARKLVDQTHPKRAGDDEHKGDDHHPGDDHSDDAEQPESNDD
jgi:hypothetical protein